MAAAVMAMALVLGMARYLGEAAVAPKLGMGRHGCEQLVFKARGALGYTTRIKRLRRSGLRGGGSHN